MLTWIVSDPPSGNTPPVDKYRAHGVVVRQHGNHRVAAESVLGACRYAGAFLFERAQRRGIGVEQAQFVAGLDEIARHGAAHAADADHSDLHASLLRGLCRRVISSR